MINKNKLTTVRSLLLAAHCLVSIGTANLLVADPTGTAAVESLYGEVDFTGGPAVTFDVVSPGGDRHGVGLYRSRTPGEYWLLSAPILIIPPTPQPGYPAPVFFGERYSTNSSKGVGGADHRVELRFEVHSKELVERAKLEILQNAPELAYLKHHKVDPKDGVLLRPVAINSAFIEIQYMGTPVASSRTQSIARLSQFILNVDLTEQQLEQMAKGVENGRLAFMASLRVSGKGQGWSWGEMHTQLTSKIAEDTLLELKKTSQRRGIKDLAFVADVNKAKRKFAADVTMKIRTDEMSLLPALQPDDFASVFALGLEAMSVKDLQARYPGFDAAIAEYLHPLIEQELISLGKMDLKNTIDREVQDSTSSVGGGFSLPFFGADGSKTSTESIVKGVERAAGVKFQKDTSRQRYVLTDVTVQQLRNTASFADVRIHKSIVVEGAVAQYWLTQPAISVGLHHGVRNEWLSSQLENEKLEQGLQEAMKVANEVLKNAEGELANARNQLQEASTHVVAAEKERAALIAAHKRTKAETRKLTSALKKHRAHLAIAELHRLPTGKLKKKVASTTKALKRAKAEYKSVTANLPKAENRFASARAARDKATMAVHQAQALLEQAKEVHLKIASQSVPSSPSI